MPRLGYRLLGDLPRSERGLFVLLTAVAVVVIVATAALVVGGGVSVCVSVCVCFIPFSP